MFRPGITGSLLFFTTCLGACSQSLQPADRDYCFTRHVIDNSGAGADGVHLADFNRDGFLDVVSGWEESAELKLYLHPGQSITTQSALWPATDISGGSDMSAIEDAAFADIDGDGNIDAVVSATEGKGADSNRRLRLHQMNAAGWASHAIHHDGPTDRFMKVRAAQIDGAHGADIVALSRNLFENASGTDEVSTPGGVFLYSAPTSEESTQPQAWIRQHLADVPKGKSIELLDVDADGDIDILYSGARNVAWLENPRFEAASQKWTEHWIGTASDLALCDVDGDGNEDIVATASRKEYPVIARWFAGIKDKKKRQRAWQAQDIRIDPGLSFNTFKPAHFSIKSIACADFDGDSQIEIALTTSGSGYGIFVAKAPGNFKDNPNKAWTVEAITSYQLIMKYDNILPADIDGDGDIDLVTSEENEGWLLRGAGVLWYENRDCGT